MQNNINNTHNISGEQAEQTAKEFLIAQGLIFVQQNFHSRFGEIDLIMKDNDTLVFIEVKYRKNALFGGAVAAISTKKQQKIIKTTAIYLQQQGLNEYNTPCRFDVIAIEGNITALNKLPINWLKNAFN